MTAIDALVGALGALLLAASTRRLFAHEAFARANYRGHSLPTGVGLLLPLVVGGVVAVAAVVGSRPAKVLEWDALAVVGPTVVGITAGFALLGLVDDIGGVGQSGGFRSHLAALFRGRLTTGALKLLGGPVIALALLAGTPFADHRVGVLRDAAIICLAANLANLLDRAPGRVAKCGIAAFVVLLLATGAGHILAPVAVVVGAAIGLLILDLREIVMLGDAGANALGAALGLGVVISTSATTRWWTLGGLLVINVASEVISFSRVIDAVAPLRFLDRLGAPHRPFREVPIADAGPPEVS